MRPPPKGDEEDHKKKDGKDQVKTEPKMVEETTKQVEQEPIANTKTETSSKQSE